MYPSNVELLFTNCCCSYLVCMLFIRLHRTFAHELFYTHLARTCGLFVFIFKSIKEIRRTNQKACTLIAFVVH